MAQVKVLHLEFADGTDADVRVTPRTLILAERHYGKGPVGPMEQTLYGAFVQIGSPGGDFDAWLDTIAGMEENDAVPLETSMS